DACVAGGAPRPPELSLVVAPGEPSWRRVELRSGVVQLEAPLTMRLPEDAARLVRYVELSPRGDIDGAVDTIARAGARVKVRCGGRTPAGGRSPQRLAAVLVACAKQRVPLKATAGLHHPFRSHATGQHGFLNLLAAASAAMAGEGPDGLATLLDLEVDAA